MFLSICLSVLLLLLFHSPVLFCSLISLSNIEERIGCLSIFHAHSSHPSSRVLFIPKSLGWNPVFSAHELLFKRGMKPSWTIFVMNSDRVPHFSTLIPSRTFLNHMTYKEAIPILKHGHKRCYKRNYIELKSPRLLFFFNLRHIYE